MIEHDVAEATVAMAPAKDPLVQPENCADSVLLFD
jgi:hypothetical protein